MKRLLLVCLFCPGLMCCMAQSTGKDSLDVSLNNVFEVELNLHVGKLIKIHGEYPSNKTSSVTELAFSFKTRGKKRWHVHNHFPSVGFSLVHVQFGNRDVLGDAFGVFPHARFQLKKGRVPLFIRGGLGAAAFTKPYNALHNPENLVLGSRIANISQIGLATLIPVGEKFRLTAGLSGTHSSDFHLRVPNIGANIVALSVGISYCNKRKWLDQIVEPKEIVAPTISKWKCGFHGILGFHEFQGTIEPKGGPVYPVYGVSLFASKSSGLRDRIGVGINAQYYTAFHDYIIGQELFSDDADERWNASNLVLFVQYEWMLGHFAMQFQLGVNLHAPFYHALNQVWDLPKNGFINEWTASKLGYRYYLLNPLAARFPGRSAFVGVAIKTNGGTADFLETSVGFIF